MEFFNPSWGSEVKGFFIAVFNQIGLTAGRSDPDKISRVNSTLLAESSATESSSDITIGYHERGREKFSAFCHRAVRVVLLARKLPNSIFGNLISPSVSSARALLCDTRPGQHSALCYRAVRMVLLARELPNSIIGSLISLSVSSGRALLGGTQPEHHRAAEHDPSAVYFIWDSGSRVHVTFDFLLFTRGVTFVKDGPMLHGIVEGPPVQAQGYGSVDFKIFKLDKVWYAPGLKKHLISVSGFTDSNPGLELTFMGARCTIREPSKGDRLGKLVWEGVSHEKLFMIELR